MNENEKSIPQNVSMEVELLGSLLLGRNKVISDVANILKPADFYSGVNGIFYEIILKIHSRGVVPDVQNIWEEIQKHRDFKGNESVFKNSLANFIGANFTTAYAIDQAETIKKLSIRRQAIQCVNGLQRDLYNPDIDTLDIFSAAEKAFRSFNTATTPTELITPQDYFSKLLDSDIDKNKPYALRKTGFTNIDEKQIFAPGLYVIGATPACGKTTFAWQLLEQLAQNGEFCIFCSYEMSRLELYSKTLARKLFLRDPNSTLTAADIRKGATSNTLESLKKDIKSDPNFKGVNLFEFQNETVDDLLRLIRPYCTNDKSPVICLDYLQVVPPPASNKNISDKQRIDDIVRKLKTFQRETNTTFIVISSFNRVNYYVQVTFESFKESGNIEYTADVIWALQLDVANHIKFGEGISEIRKKFNDAKKQQPREIQLKCLKNRNGMNYDCYFEYYSAHDFFKPCSQFDSADETTTENWGGFTEDDFAGEELPKAEQDKINSLLT